MKYLGEPLNGFVLNSQGRRVWSLARMSLNVKVKGQGHHKQLVATLRWFMAGVQSASLYDNFCKPGNYVIDDIITRKL